MKESNCVLTHVLDIDTEHGYRRKIKTIIKSGYHSLVFLLNSVFNKDQTWNRFEFTKTRQSKSDASEYVRVWQVLHVKTQNVDWDNDSFQYTQIAKFLEERCC